MSTKVSIRFFDDKEVRAVWDEAGTKWLFAVPDIVGILADSTNPATYWRVLKNRLIKRGSETVTKCNALKLRAADGQEENGEK